MKPTAYQKAVTHERTIAPYLPQYSHASKTALVCRDGDLQRTWQVQGVAFETADENHVNRLKEQLNTLILSMGGNQVAIWSHQIHRRTTVDLPQFPGDYAAEFNQRLGQRLNAGQAYTTELYITLVYRPTPTRAMRAVIRAGRRSTRHILDDQKQALDKLDELSRELEMTLQPYQLNVLGMYTNARGIVCCSALSFLNSLCICTGQQQEIATTFGPINEHVGNASLFVGTETIEIQTPDSTQWAKCIELKTPAATTETGIFNDLLYLPFEYAITQSFSLIDKPDALTILRRQKKYLETTEDAGASQIDALDVAMDDLTSNRLALGEYHFVMTVYGDTATETTLNTSKALSTIKDSGFIGCISGTATDSAWYSQFPCNWFYRPRVWYLTSRNFAGMVPLHNQPTGKRKGNPWGDCLTCFETPGGQPYYFSYHACADVNADYTDKQIPACTIITGKTGTGKTVLLNRNLLQAQRYANLNTVTFDIDQAARSTIESIDGCYMSFELGKDSGCNPFQIDDTESNILLLESLVRTLASDAGEKPLTDEHIAQITHATRAVMRLPKHSRRLSVLLQNLTPTKDGNGLINRLSKWCAFDADGNRGAYAWALDCETDAIDLTHHNNYGFDCTALLETPDIRTAVIQYLMIRIQPMIYGPMRFVCAMDEGFKYLNNAVFVDMIANALPTWRKHDALLVMATQSPATIKNSAVYDELSEQIATAIHLPNPDAKAADYQAIGCTPTEYETITGFLENSRLMLIRQNGQSIIAINDLSGLADDMAILSNKVN